MSWYDECKHKIIFSKIRKHRGPGYEYWSKRPYSNYGGCCPGRFSKTMTHRLERLESKKIIQEQLCEMDGEF